MQATTAHATPNCCTTQKIIGGSMNKLNRIPAIPGKSRFALERWFKKLHLEGLLFHPDDQPEDIVSIATGEQVFAPLECQKLREGIRILFESHGDLVYEVALNYFQKSMEVKQAEVH
jgi:hypothetical protein